MLAEGLSAEVGLIEGVPDGDDPTESDCDADGDWLGDSLALNDSSGRADLRNVRSRETSLKCLLDSNELTSCIIKRC